MPYDSRDSGSSRSQRARISSAKSLDAEAGLAHGSPEVVVQNRPIRRQEIDVERGSRGATRRKCDCADERERNIGVTESSSDDLKVRHDTSTECVPRFQHGDIDFLVDLNPKSFDRYMDLKEFLESLFGRKVDLVMKSALKSRLRESILREAVRAA